MTGTVTLEREAVLAAVGWLMGVHEFLTALNVHVQSQVGELFGVAADDLRQAAFGSAPQDDRGFERDPVIVEAHARAYEQAAKALGRLADTRELVKPLDPDELWRERSRLEQLAAEIREHGDLAPDA